ncbi:hypothetical protein F5B21DRAFT_365765 [Xylaria acuta]|nr:hypothetical protein F5B21DRAFT_365765 [Xylaria acuta]
MMARRVHVVAASAWAHSASLDGSGLYAAASSQVSVFSNPIPVFLSISFFGQIFALLPSHLLLTYILLNGTMLDKLYAGHDVLVDPERYDKIVLSPVFISVWFIPFVTRVCAQKLETGVHIQLVILFGSTLRDLGFPFSLPNVTLSFALYLSIHVDSHGKAPYPSLPDFRLPIS